MSPNVRSAQLSEDAIREALGKREYLTRGKRGTISLTSLRGRKVLVKEKRAEAAVNTIAHEAQVLKAVNEHGIGPLFVAFIDGMLVMEFIDGEEIADWIGHATKANIKQALLDILAQCRTLDELGINKLEMTHPHKHILVRKGKPVFIDFERARRTQKPKNVTQVCQWMTSKEISALLAAKSVLIPRDAMLAHAKHYKQQYGTLAYGRMREVILHA